MSADMQLDFDSAESVCALVAGDPSHARERAAVIDAVKDAALGSFGEPISRNDIAPYVPSWVQPQVIGATISGLVSKRVLVWTGRWDSSEDREGRNVGKPCKVYEFHGDRMESL